MGRDRNAGTGVPWDDGGSVLRQYGEDTKLDLKNSSWQQRISDSDLPTGGFSWSQSERLPKGRSTQEERLSKGMSMSEDV